MREKSAVIYCKLPNKAFRVAHGPCTGMERRGTLTVLQSQGRGHQRLILEPKPPLIPDKPKRVWTDKCENANSPHKSNRFTGKLPTPWKLHVWDMALSQGWHHPPSASMTPGQKNPS